MEYVRLGQTGLKVSRLCLGMMSYSATPWHPWTLDEDAARPFIKRALELGINFFDTADMYARGGSEAVTGRALRDFARREEVIIATKVFNAMSDDPNDVGLSRKHIMDSIDRSLKRLQTDYVDLYIIHRWDSNTPIEETLEALNDVVRLGKVRYIGASSMFAWQFAKAIYLSERKGWAKFGVDAKPLQPGLPRRGARDDPAVPGGGYRLDPLEPLCPRVFSRQSQKRRGGRHRSGRKR